MARIALLIGVSEYGNGLESLPGTQEDIRAVQRVLQNPEIGGFDSVDLLSNPDPTQMQQAIETLFTENRNRDDLVLLYFSGHGVRDDNGTLYFGTRITEKNAQGRIRTSTAVAASSLQYYMSQSRSKRQVLILDCCFSGAFASDMKAKSADAAIDVKAQLGNEGRAVLTSSTATQVSYEKEGASIYTRYLVQGLETGAADRDENGQITIDELHEYAKEKVQEAAPTMQPEVYAVKEGYKIFIARALQGDPKLVYRKELEERAKQKRGKLSPTDERAMKFRWQELGLSAPEAEQITLQVLQPYQEFWSKVEEFEQAIKEILNSDPQISATNIDDLRYFQRILKLRDEDILPILNIHNLNLNLVLNAGSAPTGLGKSSLVSPDPTVKSAPTKAEEDLSSKKGVDYNKLRDLLKAQKWKEADKETYEIMIRAVGGKSKNWLTDNELVNFPCPDLKIIDSLWMEYSNGHFGFSVQKQVWQECGSPEDGKAWAQIYSKVGWQNLETATFLLLYSELKFSVEKSPQGELPAIGWWGVWEVPSGWKTLRTMRYLQGANLDSLLRSLFSRIETCRL